MRQEQERALAAARDRVVDAAVYLVEVDVLPGSLAALEEAVEDWRAVARGDVGTIAYFEALREMGKGVPGYEP